MQVDTSVVIKDYQGKEMVKSFMQGEEATPVTIRRLIQFAMTSPVEGDERMAFGEKFKLHKIAEKSENPVAEYNAKEISTIVERAAKIFTALVFGRLKEAIDPEPEA